MPDRLAEAMEGGRLRHLRHEVTVRKLKCVPGFIAASLFRLFGWSGISMLAIATPQ